MFIQKKDVIIGVFLLFFVSALAFVIFTQNLPVEVNQENKFINSEQTSKVGTLFFSDLNEPDYSSETLIYKEGRYISPSDSRQVISPRTQTTPPLDFNAYCDANKAIAQFDTLSKTWVCIDTNMNVVLPDLNAYVTYQGALSDVNLGSKSLITGNIKDNAVTPLLSIDPNTRRLYSRDGSTIMMDYSNFSGTIGSHISLFLAGAGNTTMTGDHGFMVGYNAGKSNTTGSHNNFIGVESGTDNTTGYSNFFTGYRTGWKNTTGYENIFMGYASGYSNVTGKNNIYVGTRAGFSSIGSDNLFLGTNAGRYETGSDSFYLDNRDRGNIAGGKEKSLMYGLFNSDPINQKLYINADLHLKANNRTLFFGDENNASIKYDGNDLLINPNEVGVGQLKISGDLNVGDKNIYANCYNFLDGNTLCGFKDFPNPDLSEYAKVDGASFTGDVNVVGNVSASNSINWGYGQANKKNSYMNLPIRSSDWNTEVHFFDAEVLPKYTSGTITQWDVMNSQSISMPTVMSCRTSTAVNSNCILAFMGRTPATSGFHYNSTIGSPQHIKNFVTRVKLWDINAKIVIGSFASGELSATLANYWTKGNGVNFLSQIDENGNGTWGFRCGNSNSINDSGVSIDNNKWYVLRITGNQDYGYGLGATSFDFYVDENRIGTCTPANYAHNNGLHYSTIGFWTQNTTSTTTLGQDIIVVDWVYVEENRWDYDDVYKFTGGTSSP